MISHQFSKQLSMILKVIIIVFVSGLTACDSGTSTSTIESSESTALPDSTEIAPTVEEEPEEVVETEPVNPDVFIEMNPNLTEVRTGQEVALLLKLDPEVPIKDINWEIARGGGEIDSVGPAVLFIAPNEEAVVIIQVTGKTNEDVPINETITFNVVLPSNNDPQPPPTDNDTPLSVPCLLVSVRTPISEVPVDLGIQAEFSAPVHCDETISAGGTAIAAGGTYNGELGERELWVFVHPIEDQKYYVQSPDACEGLPANATAGRWSTRIFFGGPPQQYDVVVAIADIDSEVSEILRQWLFDGCSSGDFPGFASLPPGLTELASVTVKTTE